MKVRADETDDFLSTEKWDTAPGSQRKLAQVCVAAGAESLPVRVGSVLQDLLSESV